MYNLVLFCKSYIGDLKRIKILKNSIDDNIPFCIVCPKKDLEIFKTELITGKETYPIHLITDEEVIDKLGLYMQKQDWHFQQIIKLGFYKMNLCMHYSIIDSDCYFIQNFYTSDFMHDENTPYFCIKEVLNPNEEELYIKNYLNRKGKC